MNDSTDTPQMAYLRQLEAKRNAAFALENPTDWQRQVTAAYTQVTGLKWTPPIRTNEPEAGRIGYEPHSPAPVAWHERVDWPEVLGTICGVLIVVAIAGACCWAAARAMGMTR